jgi:2-(1,2-epoxy-1,2-dihydrophenyl)acetyl-CoA isomerase
VNQKTGGLVQKSMHESRLTIHAVYHSMAQGKTMAYDTIIASVEDGVAVLTLNRPDTLNSFNDHMHAEVRDFLQTVRSDDGIRCLVITGAGRGFCAGQDLGDRALAGEAEAPDLGASVERNYNPLIKSIMNLEMPVVCAVNGVAAGAGANIALACDIVLAAKSASFIESFCKIGLVPDSGGTWNLPRALGLPRARGLALLGDKLPAETAADWGMIWRCVDDDALMTETLNLARHLAKQPTKGLAAIKRLLNRSFANSLDEQLELEKETMRELGRTDDYREGVAAFMEKRKPVFRGR